MSKTGPPGLGRPYRLVVVGDCNVGKTALIEHFVYGNHVVGKVSRYTEIYGTVSMHAYLGHNIRCTSRL